MNSLNRIIISRVDNLGDVILTIPIAGILKEKFPGIQIIFLGKKYTKAIVDCSGHIDQFVDWEELNKNSLNEKVKIFKEYNAGSVIHVFPNREIAKISKIAGIKTRIGTSHRWFHYLYCNKLVNLGRRKSDLHEAQLNIKLLKPLINKTDFSLQEIAGFYGFHKVEPLPEEFAKLLSNDKFNLILHPKSKGSAREWGLENFSRLVHILPEDRYKIFITGTSDEEKLMVEFLRENKNRIVSLTGKLSLTELISFINKADGLVAASTGPLHIAAAFGKKAIGIYPPIKPMHPGRWAPIGKNSSYIVFDKKCSDCRKTHGCDCIKAIKPEDVAMKLKLLATDSQIHRLKN